jgi:hypothetical protein
VSSDQKRKLTTPFTIMKKDELIGLLTSAGIAIPEGATVASLTALAKANGIELKEKDTDPAAAAAAESPIDIEARKEIEAMKPAVLPKAFTEEQVLEKTRLGLSREQAITILTTQAEHDAALAAA